MSAHPAPQPVQDEALIDLEQRIIGLQLKESPGAIDWARGHLKTAHSQFQPPHNRIQQAIFRAAQTMRPISIAAVAADLHDYPPLDEVGGVDYLRNLAFAAPAVPSDASGSKQMADAFQAWAKLRRPLPKIGDVSIIRADSITPEKIDWLWDGWLAAGKFHLLAGCAGTGKTTLSLALAATITTGGSFPCGAKCAPGSVLMWTGEDDLADSIVPRFMACGGDVLKFHFVRGVRGENGETVPFDPAFDMPQLLLAASEIPDLRMMILDPVVSAVAGDSHKNADTRRSLQPLVDFAARASAALLGITHYSKGTSGQDPADRVTGSLAFNAVARLVMATAKPKEQGESLRLVRAKSNISATGGGFEYQLGQVLVDELKGIYGQSAVWGEPLEGTAQALLAEVESPDDNIDAPMRDSAQQWLLNILGTGTVRAPYIQTAAREAGHSWRTVNRAKKELGVISINGGKQGWLWYLSKKDATTRELDCQPETGGNVATLPGCHANKVGNLDGTLAEAQITDA